MPRRPRERPDPMPLWWEIPTRLRGRDVLLRVNEPSIDALPQLLDDVRSGRYRRPFVVDDGPLRRLQFGLRYVQSEMRLRAPDALVLDYTRKMMAALLLVPAPAHVLLVGLGGGALLRFCRRWLPDARLTAIEIDAEVIDVARSLFHVPRPDAGYRLIHGDAARVLAEPGECADLILVDGCDALGVAPMLATDAFAAALRRRLGANGALAFNLVGTPRRQQHALDALRRAFDGRCAVVPVPGENHRVALAWTDDAPLDWDALGERAQRLDAALPLDFGRFARMLRRGVQR